MTLKRLNKHIADLGIASRRKADELIAEGKVLVNGHVETNLGTKVDPVKDTVEVSGVTAGQKEMRPEAQKKLYVALNKPVDYITSTTSDQGKSVMDLLTVENYIARNKERAEVINSARLYPVGRLDKDSEGLVLLTNDGELANTFMHPRYEHEKEYEVTINEPLTKEAEKVLSKGMFIDREEYVQGIQIIDKKNLGRRTIVTVILKEGKNRQVRKMFGRLGYNIQNLRRTRVGEVKLGTLPVGRWKFIKM